MSLSKARERQKALREANKRARRPERDDVARVALFWLISGAVKKGRLAELERLQDKIVAMLVDQGFDQRESDLVFDDLVAKYRSGVSPFRRKIHLRQPHDPDEDE